MDGAVKFTGLDAETWNQGIDRLRSLRAEVKLAGPWDAPALTVDRQRFVEQFKHQLHGGRTRSRPVHRQAIVEPAGGGSDAPIGDRENPCGTGRRLLHDFRRRPGRTAREADRGGLASRKALCPNRQNELKSPRQPTPRPTLRTATRPTACSHDSPNHRRRMRRSRPPTRAKRRAAARRSSQPPPAISPPRPKNVIRRDRPDPSNRCRARSIWSSVSTIARLPARRNARNGQAPTASCKTIMPNPSRSPAS